MSYLLWFEGRDQIAYKFRAIKGFLIFQFKQTLFKYEMHLIKAKFESKLRFHIYKMI